MLIFNRTIASIGFWKPTSSNLSRIVLLKSRHFSSNLDTESFQGNVPKSDLNRPTIGRTIAEQEYLYLQQPDMPENPRTLKISVLGVPNAGKSTLVNRIMNRRISSVSRKINTTRNRLSAVLTDNDAQLVFLDTPGLISYKKQKKFNVDRQFIIDPHSSLWESDVVLVVHDVSDEYARGRIDTELLKCLFAHPEKESILVLNKIDKLKNKKILLDLVADLTGGILNGKEFVSKENSRQKFLTRHSLRDYDYEKLFEKTAEKMGRTIQLESGSKRAKEVAALLDELKTCEEYLMKNLDKITTSTSTDVDIVADEKRISLEKLKGDYIPDKLNPSKFPESNKELDLIGSIVNSSNVTSDKPLRRIEDISPEEFKRDLLQTTDWHLYYKKLNALGVLVREKTYWPYFNQVFMVSAKMDDGIEELKRYLFARAKPGQWLFSRNLLTDQMPQDMAVLCVREKMLENMEGEVPYEMGIEVSDWDVDDSTDCLNICMNLIPGGEKGNYARHVTMLLKDHGRMIKLICEQARQEIMNTFHCEVRLKLNITKKMK